MRLSENKQDDKFNLKTFFIALALFLFNLLCTAFGITDTSAERGLVIFSFGLFTVLLEFSVHVKKFYVDLECLLAALVFTSRSHKKKIFYAFHVKL